MSALASLALALTLVTDHAASPAEAAARTMSVRLHDYGDLDDGELRQAEEQVSAIYESIGVQLEWRLPVRPQDVRRGLAEWPADAPAELSVLLVKSGAARGIGVRTDVAGYAALSRDHGGRLVFIVADRTQRIANAGHVTHARVLARVIAHELAHLLMPNRSHSREGIMRARWQPGEFRMPLGRAFSSGEAEDIRRAVSLLAVSPRPADN